MPNHTPETEPDEEENILSPFTLENDEIPPGMEQTSVPDPSSYGVPSRSSYHPVSSLIDNEPEITHMPTKKHRDRENSLERMSEYCPEDVAADFFNEEEHLPCMYLTPAKIAHATAYGEAVATPEQPAHSNSSASQPLVVMGESIHGNDVDEAAEMRQSIRLCSRLAFILIAGAALAVVLLFTPANKAIDFFADMKRDKNSGSNSDANVETGDPSQNPTTMSPTSAPVLLSASPTPEPSSDATIVFLDSNESPSPTAFIMPPTATPTQSPISNAPTAPSKPPTRVAPLPISENPTIEPSDHPSSSFPSQTPSVSPTKSNRPSTPPVPTAAPTKSQQPTSCIVQNIALGKFAAQSSTDFDGDASRAVDGDTNSVFTDNSISHTAQSDNPWWYVDFGGAYMIEKVVIWNRLDCCSDRLSGAKAQLLSSIITDGSDNSTETTLPDMTGVEMFEWDTTNVTNTDILGVLIFLPADGVYLSLAEVEVFGVHNGCAAFSSEAPSVAPDAGIRLRR